MATRSKDSWLERVARLAAWAELAYRHQAQAEDFEQAYGSQDNRLLAEPCWIEHNHASAFVLCDRKNGLVIAVTGTNSLEDWSANLRLGLEEVGSLKVSSTAWHQAVLLAKSFCSLAFVPAGGQLRMINRWQSLLGQVPAVTVIGHSLGGAVAMLFPLAVRLVLGQLRSGKIRVGGWNGAENFTQEQMVALLEQQAGFWRSLTHDSEVITYGAWRPLTVDTAAYYPYRSTHVELVGDMGVFWPPTWLGRWHPGRLIVVDAPRYRLYARNSFLRTLWRQLLALPTRSRWSDHQVRSYVQSMSSWLEAPEASLPEVAQARCELEEAL